MAPALSPSLAPSATLRQGRSGRRRLRILFLTQWYAPEPDGRVSSLASALAQRGHAVTALTAFPNYPQGRIYPGYRQRWRQWEERDGVRLLRLPIFPDHSRSALKRSANYLSFWASNMLLGPWMAGPVDVIWAYTSLMGLPALWHAALHKAPFVLEIADIWPETLVATGMLREGLATRSLASLSSAVYRRAAAVTVQSRGFKANLEAKGVAAEKVHVVENVADDALYHPASRDPELGRRYGLEGRFNVVFAGMMGTAQGLETLIQAAQRLREARDVQLVLIGEGSCRAQAQAQARALGLSNVVFVPQQPAAAMAGFFAYADALLVHLRRDPLFKITIPSKTQSYLACGRPLLMAVAGEGAELIQSGSCGVCCPPSDPEALAAAVLRLRALSPSERSAMGEASLRLFQARFRKEMMVDKMERVLLEAVQ